MDFHSGNLLNKIKFINCDLHGICLWNNDYLFVGCSPKKANKAKIILIDLNTKNIIKNLFGHNIKILTIKKIIHPKYGECLISQNHEDSKIKMWCNGN